MSLLNLKILGLECAQCVMSYELSWPTLGDCEIVRANASLGELRRDKEKLSSPVSCEFVRVKAS